jgi:hypothetical protein
VSWLYGFIVYFLFNEKYVSVIHHRILLKDKHNMRSAVASLQANFALKSKFDICKFKIFLYVMIMLFVSSPVIFLSSLVVDSIVK